MLIEEVVGLYHGAMEFGPRALGHRSLLASATDPAVNSVLTLGSTRSSLIYCCGAAYLGVLTSGPAGTCAWDGRTSCHLPQ